MQSSAGRGVLKAAGRAAATCDVNGCDGYEFTPTASRWSSTLEPFPPRDAAIQSMNSGATVGPFPSHAIPPAVSCRHVVYSRSAYHHYVHALVLPPPPILPGSVVTECPDWPLMSCHAKTRRARRVYVAIWVHVYMHEGRWDIEAHVNVRK